ncbi:MAG: tetratricopeptide repeat protein [Acidobacteriota bacterium]|nr:tetratricopeptide repeat protein [Acidobacteriota bacterium]
MPTKLRQMNLRREEEIIHESTRKDTKQRHKFSYGWFRAVSCGFVDRVFLLSGYHSFRIRGPINASLIISISAILMFAPLTSHAQQRKPRASTATPTAAASKTITVATEPNAVVWLDEERRGVTDAAGQLELKNISAGRRSLRVRATGFAERTLTLPPARRGRVEVKLTRTTDEAELSFQQAEELREKGGEESRRQSIELYRKALKLRPRFPAAHVGLARVLLDTGDTNGALEQIDAARRHRPSYPEASAVEGRILRATENNKEAIESYRRALREARGFQPEAHAGIGIALKETGDYEGAAAAFQKAIAQLSDTEPVLYQLLGEAYEQLGNYKEAVAAYEKYLQLAPDGKLAPAINSIIEQLRIQAAEQAAPPNE